jgi:hypothetical protein
MLNPDETIMLVVEGAAHRFLAGFHPQPGNYLVHLPPEVELPAGTRCSIFCPVCHQELVTELTEELCALDMHSGGDLHRVYFSRVAGEQATFVVTAEGLLKNFGIHTDRYLEQMVHRMYRQ